MRKLPSQRCFGRSMVVVRKTIGLALVAVIAAATAKSTDNNARRSLTVKDLIEISYIVNPTISTYPELRDSPPRGEPLFSPDHKWFVLITQRGNLSTGKLEATLWLFSSGAVRDYLSGRVSNVAPKPISTLEAESNTSVISEVRWLPDSDRIAFLGKDTPRQQRLYVYALAGDFLRPITAAGLYVTQYAMTKDTIAYTTLAELHDMQKAKDDVVDVTGKSIFSLLFPRHKKLEDEDEWGIDMRPNELHVMRNGREVPTSFSFQGQPLLLSTPTLSLSPDGESLATVAPVHELPPAWAGYKPAVDYMEYLNLRPDNKYALDPDNPWRAGQYVLVNLKTGLVRPAIAAPAGRVLGYLVTTTAFWPDNRHVILTDSFVPLDSGLSSSEQEQRSHRPAIVMVSLSDLDYEPVVYLEQGKFRTKKWYRIDEIRWEEISKELTVSYAASGDTDGVPPPQRYGFTSGHFVALMGAKAVRENNDPFVLHVSESLSQSPVLTGAAAGEAEVKIIWNPNPQLKELHTGEAQSYQWKDSNGYTRSGILALPPDYQSGRRYPLVIQTHGFNLKRYFADGEFTTGSGGRALNTLGIVVLQMDMPMINFTTPQDGPFEMAGFEGAIDQLSREGIVDRSRVGIIGFSYSCFHVLYAMTHAPDLFAAASITDGNNMSYVQYVMSTDERNSLQEISEKTNGGMPLGDHLISWSRSAPNFALDKAKAPLLISSLETGELLAQWETYSWLRRLQKPVDMLWLKKESAPHIVVKPRERYISQQSAVDWFDFWLNGHEDPDPQKQEQYARWRALRKSVASPQ